MPIIKKFIIKEWMKAFLGATFILFSLVFVANIISELLRQVTSIDVIFKHHILEMPKWFAKILPVACLAGSLFGLNNLQNRNELIAIFVSGFSRRVFIFLIFQLSLMIGLLQFANNAYLIPFAKSLQWVWIKEDAVHFRENQSKDIQTTLFTDGKIWYKGKDYFTSFSAFDKNKKELREITLFYYDHQEKLKKIVEGDAAAHQGGHQWTFKVGTIFDKLSGEGFPQIRNFDKLDVELGEVPEDFGRIDANMSELSIRNLYRYISSMEKLGINVNEYKVFFYEQFSSSIICVLFALCSLQALTHPNRRGRSFGRNVSFILVFNILYWLVHYTGLALGSDGRLSPALGTFLGPGICFIYLVCFLFINRKVR